LGSEPLSKFTIINNIHFDDKVNIFIKNYFAVINIVVHKRSTTALLLPKFGCLFGKKIYIRIYKREGFKMRFEYSAGCIIFFPSTPPLFLLLHYGTPEKPLHWDFPRGNIEKGEKALEAALREAKEETGLEDLKVIEGFKEKFEYFYTARNPDGTSERVHKRVTLFLCESPTKDVKISFEHIGFEWLEFEKALERLTFKASREALVKAQKYLAL